MKKIKIIIVLIFLSGNIFSQTYLHSDKYAVDLDTPANDQDWYLDVIDAHGAWNLTRGRSEVTIAFISGSAVNWEHEDLGEHSDGFDNINRIGNDEEWSSWDDPDDNGYDDGDNGYDDDWRGIFQYKEQGQITYTNDTRVYNVNIHHGAWIAGIMSAKNVPGTGIEGISGGTDSDQGNSLLISGHDNVIHQWLYLDEAVEYAIDNGADIILLDAVVTYTSQHVHQEMIDALNLALGNDIFVIAPTGWSGTQTISYPSSYINDDLERSVFSVGASTEPDVNGVEFRHNNSNYFQGYQYHPNGLTDSKIDLVAPGEHIYTTDHNGDDGYHYIKGTTPAASMVAATVGLMLSVNSNLTFERIEEILHETAEKIGNYSYDNNGTGWNQYAGYGRLNTHRAVCAALAEADAPTVTNGDTWDEPVFTLTSIEVPENYTLTIESTVYFGPDAAFVIKPGASVTLNGGKLTNYPYCGYDGDMWLGVEVWGDEDESQYVCQGSQKQGKITIENGGIIENAEIGILVGARNGEGGYLYGKAGGIVRVPNSGVLASPGAKFINNKYGIYFLPYDNFQPNYFDDCSYVRDAWNSSYLYNCKFDVNTDYLGSSWYYAHIYFFNVEGVKVQGCDFEYNKTTTPMGHGINSYGAGYQVTAIDGAGVPYDECTFNNFAKGINNSTNGKRALTISKCFFNNNSIGIDLLNVNYATILFNDFDLGKPYECEPGNFMAIGIDMDQCTGFAIEENHFEKGSPVYSGNYLGICIAETQATDQVYKNTLVGLSYGNYAVGKNYGYYQENGLAYYCNENTGNYEDFTVEDDPLQIDGIQDPQGSELMPAGNTFSPNATYHFNNWDFNDWIGYYYYAPSTGNTNTVYYPEYINRVTREEVVGIQNQCPSHYGGGGGGSGEGRGLVLTPEERQDAELDFADNLSDYNNVKTLFDNLKDGGNTDVTLTDIETSWPNDMWELRAELIGKSPHLSQDVLMAAADKTDVLPDNVIFEILAANPDELKKEELINYLEDKENPLPAYMIDILKQVAMGSTYKTVLIRHLAHYNQVKTRAAYDIVRSILNDSVVDNNELRNWLDNIGGKRADEQIIASYFSEGNYSDATALANMMPTLYDYNDDEMAEHNYFMEMLNLQISLTIEEKTIFDFDSTEVANLVFIVENSTGTAGAQAKGILEVAYGYHYCNCINADTSGYKSSNAFNPNSFEHLLGIEISVEPNPAKEWAAFNFTLQDNESEGIIQINDVEGEVVATLPINGKQGQKVWDTRMIKSGVYFYTLNVSGFNKSGKIVVSK